MFHAFRTLLRKIKKLFRRNESVTHVTKEAEMNLYRGRNERGHFKRCPVIVPISEPPTEFVRDIFSAESGYLCRLKYTHTLHFINCCVLLSRFSLEEKGKCLFNGVVSPSGSTSSPVTPFHIKALKESHNNSIVPNRPLLDYARNGDNGTFTITSLTLVEDIPCRELIYSTNLVLRDSPPELCALGTGGVYFIRPSGIKGNNISAVFKPTDEEPGEKNNPKGHCCVHLSGVKAERVGMKDGSRPGEGALRERAVYLLDYESISGIPPTTMVSLKSTTSMFSVDSSMEKIGSLQKYIPFDFDAEECGTGLFPVEEVQKICLADIRFVNKDRNGQNILISRRRNGSVTLTPIDHGYCFPTNLKDFDFEWMYWPQAKHTFTEHFKKFIEELDPRKDLDVLASHGIDFGPECIRVFLFSNYFLKWAVLRYNYTPRDIAVVMSNASVWSTSSISSSCLCSIRNSTATSVNRGRSKLESIFQRIMHHNDSPLLELEIYQALDRNLEPSMEGMVDSHNRV